MPTTPTVDDFLAALADRGGSPATADAYRADLRQLTDFLGRRRPDWAAVGPATLVRFRDELVRRDLADATVARKVAAVRSFFRWLRASGALETNPAARLAAEVGPLGRPTRVLSRAQVEAVVGGPARPLPRGLRAVRLRDDAMLRLLAATGLRATEIVELDADDVALASGWEAPFGEVRAGRGERRRLVPVDEPTAAVLDTYLAEGRPALGARGRGDRSPALLLNARGQRLTRQGFWLVLKQRARAAGLPAWVTTGSFRDALVARLLAEHAPFAAVADRLGHADAAATVHRYRSLVAASGAG